MVPQKNTDKFSNFPKKNLKNQKIVNYAHFIDTPEQIRNTNINKILKIEEEKSGETY